MSICPSLPSLMVVACEAAQPVAAARASIIFTMWSSFSCVYLIFMAISWMCLMRDLEPMPDAAWVDIILKNEERVSHAPT